MIFNYYFLKTVLGLTSIYLVCGLGNSITMKSGDMNLGGEGQIYAGGFIAALFLNSASSLSAFIALPLAFLLSGLAGTILCLVSCYLKKNKNISFLLSSFIISSALIPILNGLITGPFRTTQGTLLATPFIPQNFRYSYLINLFVAILIAILIFLFLKKSESGKEITFYGIAPEYALFMGINETKILTLSSVITGFLHGIAGALVVCGIHYTCHCNFSSGMGWNALAAAMIANASPILLIPSSLFMAFLITTADQYALFNNFNFDISTLIQAIIIIIVSFPFFTKALKGGRK